SKHAFIHAGARRACSGTTGRREYIAVRPLAQPASQRAASLREQVMLVWYQYYDDRWEQFIYQSFGDIHTPANERQRRLVLELSYGRSLSRDANWSRRRLSSSARMTPPGAPSAAT